MPESAARYDDSESSYSDKMTEIADQLALNHADEGIDIDSRSLIESFRPGQYIRIKLTDVSCEMIDPIYHIVVLPAEERFGFQV